MIQLRLLGSLALARQDGEELPAVLCQPKRLALLAYLAAASPRGFHRRDTLLALFWPERDTEHARAALSHGLYTLRRAIGEEVIVSRGDEEVGLAPDRCWCDAVAFDDAADAGRLGEALDLYRGDLLPGFHLSEAPEFERWLEGTRGRLQDRATWAAWKLVEVEEAEGRVAPAVQWARRAVALAPYNEAGVRRLLALLDRAGDRAEAVHAYEQFARRLSADLELEPSTETLALIQAIRSRRAAGSEHNGAASGPAAAPLSRQPRAEPPAVPTAAATPPTPSASAARRRLRLQPVMLALLVVGGLGVLGAVVRSLRTPPAESASPATVAVLPFSFRGSAELGYLAEGMVELLTSRLDGAPGIRTVDPRALLVFAHRNGVAADPQGGRLAAERFGAGRFVLGSIVEAGGRLQVSATIYQAHGTPESSVEAMAEAEAEIYEVADRLARYILAEVQDTPQPLARVASRTTSSLPALKAYLEGERELRFGWRAAPARDAFLRATELDTTFALAFYRLASVSDPPQARAALERALRHSDRLAEHHRWLVEAADAYLRGDHTTADQRVRRVLTIRPDEAEAWSLLGDLTIRRGHLLARPWVDAREAFEHAVALNPQDAVSSWWLTAIAAREGRKRDLDSLTGRFLRLGPAPWWASNVRGQRAVVLGDTAEQSRFIADLRIRPDMWAQTSAGVVTWTTSDLSAGRRLWGLITEPARSRGFRVLAHATLAKIELTEGRWRAAQAQLKAIEALDAGSALEHRALFALTRFLRPSHSELAELRRSLLRWHVTVPAEGDGLLAMHRPVHPYLRSYLLGLLSARLGEDSTALRYAAELGHGARSTEVGAFAADLGQVVRAEVAWLAGRRQDALSALERARFWTTQSSLDETGDSPFYKQIHEQFTRAELLYQLGREAEALPWYRVFVYDLLYTGPAHFRLAQIYEHKGERQRAIKHYTSFIELWRSCDPELRPMVEEARHALARLR